jgi:VIT1/CCC1 family predicted Fe2+/Mn2+ transporter
MYSALADVEDDPERAGIFQELVDAELRHAARWAEKLGIDSDRLEPGPLGVRGRLLRLGARLLGTRMVLPVLLRFEDKEVDAYAVDPEARDLVPEERKHTRILRDMSETTVPGRPVAAGRTLGGGGSLRAGVLGVIDGLVSNFSLVMGVAGGTGNPSFVLLAGVAGLLAGAFSMAAGEYVSMRSQRDVYEHDLRREAIELREWPEEELEELRLIYRAKGLSKEEASNVAERIMADPQVALDTMAREELGLDPASLGSPGKAAASSFAAFVVGAAVPILPYVFGADDLAILLSAVLSAGALIAVGGILAALSDRSVWWGSLRMLIAGGAAAGVTYGVGRIIGVSVAKIG